MDLKLIFHVLVAMAIAKLIQALWIAGISTAYSVGWLKPKHFQMPMGNIAKIGCDGCSHEFGKGDVLRGPVCDACITKLKELRAPAK